MINKNFIKKIAEMLTEDPDIFSDYQEQFSKNTILDEEIYSDIVSILMDVAKNNSLKLDVKKLTIKFNPAGFTINNIHLQPLIDPTVKKSRKEITKELADRVAEITGDPNIKNTFHKNLRVNFYTAINQEFADRIREELNLEITHQSRDLMGDEDSSNVLPMATFTQPAITAEKPVETMAEPMAEPMDEFGMEPAPELAPELAPAPEGEEMEAGPFGLESPEEGEEIASEEGEEVAPEEGEEVAPEEDEEVAPEEEEVPAESIIKNTTVLTENLNVNFIAMFITEDPDIFRKKDHE